MNKIQYPHFYLQTSQKNIDLAIKKLIVKIHPALEFTVKATLGSDTLQIESFYIDENGQANVKGYTRFHLILACANTVDHQMIT